MMNELSASEVLKLNTYQAMVRLPPAHSLPLSCILNYLYFESLGESMNWNLQFPHICRESGITSGCFQLTLVKPKST